MSRGALGRRARALGRARKVGPNVSQVPPRDELWHQLSAAVALLTSQEQLLWNIFGVFSATVSILLVALFTSGSFPDRRVGVLITLFGVQLSVVWYLMQRRAMGYLRLHERLVHRLQDLLWEGADPALRLYNHADLERLVHRPRTRHVMRASVISFIAFFGGLGAYFWFQ